MTIPKSPTNGFRSPWLKITLVVMSALWAVAAMFGGRLMTNIRYDVNQNTTTARNNEVMNARQDVSIEILAGAMARMESKLDRVLLESYGYIPSVK